MDVVVIGGISTIEKPMIEWGLTVAFREITISLNECREVLIMVLGTKEVRRFYIPLPHMIFLKQTCFSKKGIST